MVTDTHPNRRVAPLAEAAKAAGSVFALLSDPRGPGDLRDLAVALRNLAGTLDGIAARAELPSPGGAYHVAWPTRPGA